VSIDILNNKLGEFSDREALTVAGRFRGSQQPLLSALNHRICSPKKLTPEERLRRYVELKYGKLNVKKKQKIVEKKS
tara:strand:- start:1633 stop:1863 length:231 start_codon:yes stop_codon:yes gene_type:complete